MLIVLASVVYAVFIAWFYSYVANRFTTVQGYGIKEVSAGLLGWSFFFAVIPALFLPLSGNRASTLLLWVLYLMHVVPSVVVAPFLIEDDGRIAFWQAVLCCSFIMTILMASLPLFRLKLSRISLGLFVALLVGAAILLLFVIYSAFGLELRMTSLMQVYERRAEFVDRLQEVSVLVGYAVILTGYWLAPVFILIGLRYWHGRRLFALIMLLLGAVSAGYVYSVAAYKSIALSFMVVATCWWVYRRRIFSAITLLAYLTGVIMVFAVLRWTWGVEFPFDHLLRRALIVPGMDSSYMFDYFSVAQLVPGENPPSIIASVYYGTDGSANAGFLAAAYPGYGYLGILAMGLISGCVLWMVDLATRKLEYAFAVAMFLMQFYAMANSALPTVLVSYGLLLSVLTASILPRLRIEREGDGLVTGGDLQQGSGTIEPSDSSGTSCSSGMLVEDTQS